MADLHPDPPPDPPRATPRWPNAARTWALAALRDLGFALLIGLGIAVFLALLFRQHFGITLVYSCCIAIGCSVSIDALRWLASAWVYRHGRPDTEHARANWPGWRWMVPCLVLGTLAGFTLGTEAGHWLLGQRAWGVYGSNIGVVVAMLLFSLVPGVTATYYFRAKSELRAAEALAEGSRRQAAETRLKLLEAQLEPHMLFNTLANLRALIAADPARAQAMLDRLIDFLRATLGGSRAALHPLSAEFTRLADYLALMQVRMGERLQVALDLPPALAAVPVPPLLLQPLVENAIKHGLEPQRGGGRIHVQARTEGPDLVLTVSDTGVGPGPTAPPGGGFGLAQVRERLATLHGARASVALRPGPAGGTIVTLRWPLPTPATP